MGEVGCSVCDLVCLGMGEIWCVVVVRYLPESLYGWAYKLEYPLLPWVRYGDWEEGVVMGGGG